MKESNQRGIITADFLFAIVLVFGFTSILFSLAFTLSMSEVTQYITFAAARTYSAGNESESAQREAAIAKYTDLIGSRTFRPLYTNGWFKVDGEPEVGDLARIFPEYQPLGIQQGFYFTGVGTNFTAMMLDFNIPFYGSTSTEEEDGKGFKSFIASYLGRDISTEECRTYYQQRWTHIKALDSIYARTPNKDLDYVAIDDSGC